MTLGLFLYVAIVNSAAMNLVVQVSFQISVLFFSRHITRGGIVESQCSAIFIF